MPVEELEKLITDMEAEMFAAADQLKFEYAAKLRDEIRALSRELASRKGGSPARQPSRTPLPAASQERLAGESGGEAAAADGAGGRSPRRGERLPDAPSDRSHGRSRSDRTSPGGRAGTASNRYRRDPRE